MWQRKKESERPEDKPDSAMDVFMACNNDFHQNVKFFLAF
jgi:hypothetical protein